MSDRATGALDRTARRYRGGERFTRYYVAAKLRMDPVHADVLALAAATPFGRVVDVGCGFGQLGVALLEAGLADSVLGLERRTAAISQAIRAAAGLGFTAEARDLADGAPLPSADTVLLIDVLYQLDPAAQDRLLAAAASAAPHVVIRTADPSQQARFRWGQAAERLFRRVWPTSGAHVAPRRPAALAAILQQAGYTTTIAPCARGTPFSNVLIDARRAG